MAIKPVVDWASKPEPWRSRGFRWVKELERLERLEAERNKLLFRCDICGLSYLSRRGVTAHKVQAHPEVKK